MTPYTSWVTESDNVSTAAADGAGEAAPRGDAPAAAGLREPAPGTPGSPGPQVPRRKPSGAEDLSRKLIAEYRANGGRLGGMFSGSDLLLLHHTGANTAAPLVSPLAFQRIGDSYAVFASRAGSASNPDWFYNVVARPRTLIEVGTETVPVIARVAQPAERDVIWDRQKKRAPQFADYERKAAPRKIPVIVLDPVRRQREAGGFGGAAGGRLL